MKTEEVINKTKWSIDPSHSEIAFKIKHLGITNVRGIFKEFDASIYTNGNDFLTSEIDLFINAESIDTRDEKRDEHLKGTEFFDVKSHKQITFVGDSIVKIDRINNYEIYGRLTMRGITNKIKLELEFGGIIRDPWGNEKAGFTIEGKVNRKDWGIAWNANLDAGGFMLGDEVKINCEIQLIKKPE